jgi:hypothetical protein
VFINVLTKNSEDYKQELALTELAIRSLTICMFLSIPDTKNEANSFYYNKGYIILKLWYSVLKISATPTYLFSNISKNKQKHGIKMEKVCKLCYQANFETLA